MAEETTTPTDGLNDLSLNSTLIKPASIEMREPDSLPALSAPLPSSIQSLPGGNGVPNKTYSTKDFTVGSTPTYPRNVAGKSISNIDKIKGIAQKLNAELAGIQDDNSYAKLYSYDSSPTGAFKNRYKAYGQETYNKLGFNPNIDNESWYNQNTTAFDDTKRILTASAGSMFGLGFLAPVHSYGNMLGAGDIGADVQEARDYDYYNQIGYSTKGGIGGFINNTVNSAAYSMGILAEGALEGALIGAAVGFVEGGIGAVPGAALGGVTGMAKSLLRLPSSLYQAAKNAGRMATSLKNAAKFNNAKNLFVNAGKNLGNFANPLSNSVAAYNELKNAEGLTDLARASRSAGAFWHDVMSLNMALSEGRLEGGFTEQNMYKKLYDDYYATYGQAPNDDLQTQMVNQAKTAGFVNTVNNAALVFYSNKIAFPSITRAGFLKGLPKTGFGTVVGQVGKEFQVVYTPAKKVAESAYTLEKIGLRNALRSVTKPKIWGRVGLNYFKKNLVEGFQEVSQEALADATEQYWTDAYNNPAVRSYLYGAGTLVDGLKKQASGQGAEVFASGFVMGSILTAPSTLMRGATSGFNRYYKHRADWNEYITKREKQGKDVVNALNTMHKDGKYFFDPRLTNYSTQMLVGKMADNPEENTTNELKDAEFTGFTNAVITSLRTGTFDMFMNNFKEYKTLTPEELEQAWSLEPGQGQKALEGIDKSIQSAGILQKRYDVAKSKMRFMQDPSQFKEGTEEFKKATIYNAAYQQSLTNLVFLQGSFDDNVNRLNKMYQEMAKVDTIANSRFSDVANLVEADRLDNEINMLQTEVDSLARLEDPKAAVETNQKRELLKSLRDFQEKQNNLLQEYVVNKLQKEYVKKYMEENPSMTEEEANVKAFNEEIKKFENNESTPFTEYKQSFENLLKSLAGSDEKVLKLQQELDNAGGIDKMYDSLLDMHIIKNQKNGLAKYVNLLNDPAGFSEHIDRNFEWMKKMYNNKEDQYKKIVNTEFTNIERNEILAHLADQGIFVDLDEFAKWIEDSNYLPEYFIDGPKGMIINKDTILYQEYIEAFVLATQAHQNPPAGNPTNDKQKMDARIEELEEKKIEELGKAKTRYDKNLKDEFGFTEEEYAQRNVQDSGEEEKDKENRKKLEEEKVYLDKAISILDGKDPIQAIAVRETAVARGYLTKELYLQAQNSIAQNDATYDLFTAKFRSYDSSIDELDREEGAVASTLLPSLFNDRLAEIEAELSKPPVGPSTFDFKGTKQYKTYQEEISAITAQYDGYIQEVRDEYKAMGVDENTVIEYSTQTPFDELPIELQNELNPLLDEHLKAIGEDAALKTVNPEQYEKIRKNWLETQGTVINAFNEKVKAEVRARAQRLAKPPVLRFSGIKLKIGNNPTGNDLNTIHTALTKILKDGAYADKGEVFQLTPEDISNIKADIEDIEGYLDARAKTYQPQSVLHEIVKIIEDNVLNRKSEIEDVTDEEGNKLGRRFVGSSPTTPLPLRATQIAQEVEVELLGKEPFLFKSLKNGQMQALFNEFFNNPAFESKDKLGDFMTAFERESKTHWKVFNSEKKLAALRESLEKNPTVENLEKTVQKLAFEEWSNAGTKIDKLIRIFLTPAVGTKGFMEVKWNKDDMSKEAFDALFGTTGIISKFRNGIIDGQYTILSENVTVFDKTLRENGISGEMDLLAIDVNGNVKIIDIKTGKASNWNNFGKGTEYDKETNYRAQQSIYRNLFYNMTGIMPVEIGLMPLAIDVTVDGYIKSVKLASIVPKDSDTIKLEYLPEVEQYGVTPIKPDLTKVEVQQPGTEVPLSTTEIDKQIFDLLNTEDNYINWSNVRDNSDRKNFEDAIDFLLSNINQALEKRTLTEDLLNTLWESHKVGRNKKTKGAVIPLILQKQAVITAAKVAQVNVIPQADLKKTKLIDNVGETVIYNGQTGKLTLLDDGVYALEVEENGVKKLIDIMYKMQPIKNGLLSVSNIGVSLITPIKAVGQVGTVNNVVIDAAFNEVSEKTATINGVKYKVNRNSTGNIVSLSYMINDQKIADIEVQTKELSEKNSRRRAEVNELTTKNIGLKSENLKQSNYKINSLIRLIAQDEIKLKALNAERLALVENNIERTVKGDNANDYIFALNRLPNSFQKGHKTKSKAVQKAELRDIDRLSLSQATAEKITKILETDFPEAINTLIEEGIGNVSTADLLRITLWAQQTISNLEQLGFTVINRGDLLDDIDNQISAINDLLNDINLIKLNKDGRISKVQRKQVKEAFGPTRKEISDRTSLPPVQEPTSRQTEGVLRSATEEELRELVKQVRGGADIGLESLMEEVVDETNPFISAMINTKDLKELDVAYTKAVVEASKEGSTLDMDNVTKVYDQRKIDLQTVVSSDNLKAGSEHLISIVPIFTEGSGEIVLVKSVKNGVTTVQDLQTKKTKEFTEEELKQSFEKTNKEATEMGTETIITEEDKTNSEESAKTFKEFLDDKELIAKLKEEGKNTSAADIFNKLIDNSKLCQ